MTGRREGALAGGPLLRHGPEPASRRHGSGWAVAVLAAAPQEGPVHVSVFGYRLSGIGEEWSRPASSNWPTMRDRPVDVVPTAITVGRCSRREGTLRSPGTPSTERPARSAH